MHSPGIHDTRIRHLNDREISRRYVSLMQQSQRAEFNHALEHAGREANRIGQGFWSDSD
jgi:hypothetical protein